MKIRLSLLSIVAVFIINSCNYESETDYTELVYPHLDSVNSRWFFFNSATRPFGMINLSPDTDTEGTWGSGYLYNSDTIRGFSHVHAWQLSGVSLLPVGNLELSDRVNYFSPFSHENETVKPGYHKVLLERYNITAELTSTLRVGFHKYTFNNSGKKQIILNLGGNLGPSEMIAGEVKVTGTNTLVGKVVNGATRRRPHDTPIFFAIKLNQKIASLDGWVGQQTYSNVGELSGKNSGVFINLDSEVKEVLMKVGISYVNQDQALLNLNEELDHWDFNKTVAASRKEWNTYLGKIQVKGGSLQDRRRFYTDLWHALQGRRTISDINGKYADYTNDTLKVRQIPLSENGNPLFRHFNSDSFWGAQWTLNTLWHLVYPNITEEFVNSLVQYYKDGGMIPRGPSGGNYTYVMTGSSATPFIVSAYQKGIRSFDINAAYEGLKKNHMPGGIMSKAGYEHDTNLGGGLTHYIDKGYVPWPIPEGNFGFHQDGPSLTMEYAYQDWTLAQMAKALNKQADYEYFITRSNNYINVFDSTSGWMRPKDINGNWATPYDPYDYGLAFNEANGAQASWFVPHDLHGLSQLMGGTGTTINKLNTSFEKAEELSFTSGTSHEQETHQEYKRIPINYGNQPSIQTAFIFHKLGEPNLTQYWSRRIVEQVYSGLDPNTGYNGDEDQGLMGALSVLLKIGLFQMSGGTEENSVYEIGSPIFDEVIISLNPDYYSGNTFTIKAENNKQENVYVGKASFNNEWLNNLSLTHNQIINGGELILKMTNKPATKTMKLTNK
ncbi:MAG: GH92 family glycosyl hydrolase [Bacteroidota bacterium]